MRYLILPLLFACDPFEEATPADTDTVPVVDVEGCTETYTVPGPLGNESGLLPDPHQEVYGQLEYVGAEGTSAQVGPDPMHVHVGLPGRDSSISLSVVWRTDSGTLASVIEWGKDGALDQRQEGVSLSYGGTSGVRYRSHEVKLCGRLEPGTTYSYRVGGEGHWSPTFTYTTPMPPGSFDSYVVAMSGDARGAYETWGQVVAKMETHSPDLYLFSGDMADIGSNEDEWFAFWEASGDVFARKQLIPAHGNHEFLASNYFAQFSLPNNEQWFAVDYGDMTLVSLNDTVKQYPEDIEYAQAQYIDQIFTGATQPWKFAMHHQPMYSTCTTHGSNSLLRELWGPKFDSYGVDVVLSGHNHIYERSVPIRGGAEVPMGEGTLFLVSGGAGADLYPNSEDQWFGNVANPVLHYVIATFTAAGAHFDVYDMEDNVIDTFEIPRTP